MSATNLRPAPRPVKPAASSGAKRVIDVDVVELVDQIVDRVAEILVAQPPRPALCDRRELCRLLNVSIPIIKQLETEGLPFLKLGSCIRYRVDDCITWLRARSANPGDPVTTPPTAATIGSRDRRLVALDQPQQCACCGRPITGEAVQLDHGDCAHVACADTLGGPGGR